MLAQQSSSVAGKKAMSNRATVRPVVNPSSARRTVQPARSWTALAELAASATPPAPGSVDAPEWVPYVAGIVITIASTALIPLWLKPGQEAADQIFDAERRTSGRPLDKKRK